MNETIDSVKRTGYVAHLDMLGCRKAVEYNAQNAWLALNTLYGIQQELCQQEISVLSTGQKIYPKDYIKVVNFSDTIIIYTEQINHDNFHTLLVIAAKLFLKSLEAGIPLRGGVAYGDFYFDAAKNLYSGMPFVRAYEAGESAQWLGIVVDPETLPIKLPKEAFSKAPFFVEWNVPVKNGMPENKLVVNWPYILSGIKDCNFPKSIEELYECKCKDIFGPYKELEDGVKCKYENTQIFIDAQLKQRSL